MQIRIANRQDEAEIRTFVESICKESGSSFNLETDDVDLRNIEGTYFGKEGLFLVAESDGKIVGVAGAKKKSESTLELKRLLSQPVIDENAIDEMLRIIIDFAPRMLYEKIETALTPAATSAQEKLFEARGFELNSDNSTFALTVQPSF